MEYKLTNCANFKADGPNMAFSGYGAVFGNVDSYNDVIAPGAFKESLAKSVETGSWPAMLLQHGGFGMSAEDRVPIGVWTNLVEDANGLFSEGFLADTQKGRDIYALFKTPVRPAISGLSIGYNVVSSSSEIVKGQKVNVLTAIDLKEISVVTFPANDLARVTNVKNEPTIRVLERALREAGCSVSEAKEILAKGYKSSRLRDVGEAKEEQLQQLLTSIKGGTQCPTSLRS